MRAYPGFCPVAKAAEIIAERWTPLILRELLTGSQHFNEIERGVPGIPHSLLSQRLRALAQAGVVEKHSRAQGRPAGYVLTPAGKELYAVIRALGEWGQRWANRAIGPADVEPPLLMWDMHRRIHVDRLPDRRITAQFDFRGVKAQTIWLVLQRPEPSVCLQDPGFPIDLVVSADTVALHRVWMGHESLTQAMRRDLIQVSGPRSLVRAFPTWLALNLYAGVPAASGPVRGRSAAPAS
jgi:DNA-binding HxlR family transcriptional regulator